MGYVPPPPKPASIPMWSRVGEPRRSVWTKLRRGRCTLPEVTFLTNGQTGIEYKVEPVMVRSGERWAWSVWLTFDGCRSLMSYDIGGGPHDVHGSCRSQEKADLRARAAVEDARERMAAARFAEMRRQSGGHTERVPL